MIRLLLDTDIGTDVDDALALALALKSPAVRLEGVTVVHGDVELRARLALKFLQLAGAKGIPVAKGIAKPLLTNRPIYWAGHEGEGLLEPGEEFPISPIHGPDLIISTVMSLPGQVTLAAIGPLTNVAAALIKEPRLKENLKRLVIMGGVLRAQDGLHLLAVEHNIRLDPEAAQLVFSSGLFITMIPLDVTMKVVIRREALARIAATSTPLARALVDQVERYMALRGRDWTYLHDPLAVATAIGENFVRTQELRIAVETRGEFTTGLTLATLPTPKAGANAQVALEVEAERFQSFLLDRLAG